MLHGHCAICNIAVTSPPSDKTYNTIQKLESTDRSEIASAPVYCVAQEINPRCRLGKQKVQTLTQTHIHVHTHINTLKVH